MDGILAISARISQIESTLASLTGTAAQVDSAATTASSGATTGPARTSTSFADLLAGILGTATQATAATRTVDGVPADLARYGNGRVPLAALDEVGATGQRLWAPAARAMESLLSAAAADGVSIGITDAYRDYDQQAALARSKGLYIDGGLAAVPGTSDHGWGLSVDLSLDATAQAWMRSNAAGFGFTENTAGEPWHWTFTAGAS